MVNRNTVKKMPIISILTHQVWIKTNFLNFNTRFSQVLINKNHSKQPCTMEGTLKVRWPTWINGTVLYVLRCMGATWLKYLLKNLHYRKSSHTLHWGPISIIVFCWKEKPFYRVYWTCILKFLFLKGIIRVLTSPILTSFY